MTKGNSPNSFFVHKILQNFSKSLYIINMTSQMRNTISNLYNALSALVAATRDALAERLQSARETASLLDKRMMDNIGYGRERFKDIVEKASVEKAKEQQQNDGDEQFGTVPKILVYEGTRVKEFRMT